VAIALCGRFEIGADGLITSSRRCYELAGLLARLDAAT
jgi:hypothetical protein